MTGDPWHGLRIEGHRLYLRPVRPEDATQRYVEWLNDPQTTRFLETSGRQTIKTVQEYINRYQGRKDALFLAIVLREGDRHIGNVKLEPIDWHHRHATLGIMIGEASARRRGIGTEAIVLLLGFAFEKLGLHRVSLGVTADNVAALRCYRKVGFVEEGRLRESHWCGGHWVDGIWMGILEHEFRARHGR